LNLNLETLEAIMAEEIVRIKHTGKLRGDIELVTLGFFLTDKGYSSKAFKRSELVSNTEIADYETKGAVTLVPEKTYRQELEASEKAAAASAEAEDGEEGSRPSPIVPPTVEDALDESSPRAQQVRQYIDAANTALQRLERLMFGAPQQQAGKQPAKEASKASASAVTGKTASKKAAAAEDDGIGLPQNPPAGLKPQPTTTKYLAKDAKERRKFLRQCRDITMLRDIALFETDAKLKKLARKRVKDATSQAEAASSAA
jgi:hypothetical protein